MTEHSFSNRRRIVGIPLGSLHPNLHAALRELQELVGDCEAGRDCPDTAESQAEARVAAPVETPIPVRRAPGPPLFSRASLKAAEAHANSDKSAYTNTHIDEIFAAQAIASTKSRQLIRNHVAVDAEIIRIGMAMNPRTDRDILEMLACRNEGDAAAIAKTRIADLDHAEASLRDSATQKHTVEDLNSPMDATGITVIRHITGNREIERATVLQCLGIMSDVIEKELTSKFERS